VPAPSEEQGAPLSTSTGVDGLPTPPPAPQITLPRARGTARGRGRGGRGGGGRCPRVDRRAWTQDDPGAPVIRYSSAFARAGRCVVPLLHVSMYAVIRKMQLVDAPGEPGEMSIYVKLKGTL